MKALPLFLGALDQATPDTALPDAGRAGVRCRAVTGMVPDPAGPGYVVPAPARRVHDAGIRTLRAAAWWTGLDEQPAGGGGGGGAPPVLTPEYVYYIRGATNFIRRRSWGASIGAEEDVYSEAGTSNLYLISGYAGLLYYGFVASPAPVYSINDASLVRTLLRNLPNNATLHDVRPASGGHAALVLYETQNGPDIYLGNLDGTGIDDLLSTGNQDHCACFSDTEEKVYVLKRTGTNIWSLLAFSLAGASQGTLWTTAADTDIGTPSCIRVDGAAGYVFIRGTDYIMRRNLSDGGSRILSSATAGGQGGNQGYTALDRPERRVVHATSQIIYAYDYETLTATALTADIDAELDSVAFTGTTT